MAKATNAFADEPSGTIERGRGGFYRNAMDTPYVAELAGGVVKSGPRKGLPKRTAYGSPSGFGKQIENTFNLQKWGERRVVVGIGIEAARGEYVLLGMCHALALLEVDSDAYKDLADKIVVRAKDVAETDLAAERGTHGHAIVEDDDEGRDWITRAEAGELLGIPVEAQRALVQSWRDMLIRDGLEVLITEASCIDDTWRLAGTLDNLARLTKDLRFTLPTGEIRIIPAGTVVVLDKKTGQRRTDRAGVIQYWHGYAIQVASYAQSKPYDTEAETRGEWPWDIDQEHALIAHLDVLGAINGQPSCTLVYVDLVAGRGHGGAAVVAAKSWEKRTDIFSLDVPDRAAGAAGDSDAPDADGSTAETAADGVADAPAAHDPVPVDASAGTAEEVPDPAPSGNPAGTSSKLRKAQLDRAATVAAADLAHAARQAALAAASAASTPVAMPTDEPDEGDPLVGPEFDDQWALLLTQFQRLEYDGRQFMNRLIREAREARVPFQTAGGKNVRRFELYRGAIALAVAQPDDDLLCALVALAAGHNGAIAPNVTAGHAVGSLDAAGAIRFAKLVDRHVSGVTQFIAGCSAEGLFVLIDPEDLAAPAA